MSKIALLDPSLSERVGYDSQNYGDLVIYDAVSSVLAECFPRDEIVRIPTQRFLRPSEIELVRQCRLAFLGGTNLFSGNLAAYNQWKISTSIISLLRPPMFTGVIALGVGWWQYQRRTTYRTRLFYRRILHPTLLHSVRDEYTRSKLAEVGLANVVNTACPTLWSLEGRRVRRTARDTIVFMLTDYKRAPDADNQLMTLLLETATEPLLFFPQGRGDEEYLASLRVYKDNKSRIVHMKRSLEELNATAKDARVSYIGTRLHGGIRFLQHGRDSLILAVDNRAAEMHRDTNLPVVDRRDYSSIRTWLRGESEYGPIRLPANSIADWKAQFAGI